MARKFQSTSDTVKVRALTRLFVSETELYVEVGETVNLSPEKAQKLFELGYVAFEEGAPAENPIRAEE